MHYQQPPPSSKASKISKQPPITCNPSINIPAPQPQKYKIQKNLCQQCYQTSGRYILDCYCIICQQCYSRYKIKQYSICSLCGRQTKGNKIDAKQQSSIKKIGHLFENIDIGMHRMLQIYKFQSQIVNRYCQYLQKQLQGYQNAVNQLVSVNPTLYGYFNTRVKLKKSSTQTQQYQNRSISIKPDPTIKNQRQYASQIYQSRRSTLQLNPNPRIINNNINMNAQMSGIRQIGRNGQNNHSGNVVYKVPNINYNTAVRSSKRVSKGYDKIGPQYEEQEYHRYRKP